MESMEEVLEIYSHSIKFKNKIQMDCCTQVNSHAWCIFLRIKKKCYNDSWAKIVKIYY